MVWPQIIKHKFVLVIIVCMLKDLESKANARHLIGPILSISNVREQVVFGLETLNLEVAEQLSCLKS